MSATRKGKKQAEEQDFEAFVRETLFKLCKDVEDIKGGQEKMQGDMNLPRSQVSVNEKELKSIRSLTESLSNTLEKLNGDMHAANVKIAKLTESLQERILALGNITYDSTTCLKRQERTVLTSLRPSFTKTSTSSQ